MQLPFVRRKRFEKVLQIAEERLFELNHLKIEKDNIENFLSEEINFNQEAIARILKNSGKYSKKSRIFNFNSSVNKTDIHQVMEIFNRRGSDKSTKHNYEFIYAELKKHFPHSARILEIGCGSNNPNIRHAMSFEYIPLSSLHALKEIFQSENVIGADIDIELSKSGDFEVYYLDQFNKESLDKFTKHFNSGFDIIIDDGVHDISGNYLTLIYVYNLLNPGGRYVIEDVSSTLIESWSLLLHDFGILEMTVLTGNSFEKINSHRESNTECAIVLTKRGT
jgi:hypothetical protein